jgi:hypothetical protein
VTYAPRVSRQIAAKLAEAGNGDMAKRPRTDPEAALQRSVVQFLNVAIDPERCWWTATMNGVRLRPAARAKAKAAGLMPGLPDLMFMPFVGPRAGQFVAIELKSATGRATPEQIKLISRSHVVSVARSLVEVVHWLDAWGIPLKARP